MAHELSNEEERDTLEWIDKIPFSRPKKHINRDFSDGGRSCLVSVNACRLFTQFVHVSLCFYLPGYSVYLYMLDPPAVMVAEIVKYYFPKIVDIHNYITSCKKQQKLSNWSLLNKRVFSKLDFYITEEMVEKIVSSTPGTILPVLFFLKKKLDKKLLQTTNSRPDYVGSGSQEKPFSDVEIQQAEARIVAQLAEMKSTEATVNPQPVTFFTEMNLSAIRQVMLEKELQVQELQEIVKILQLKVSKLEELVHLKDKRIEHLTCFPETYITKLQLPD